MKGSIRPRGRTFTAYWDTIDPGTGKRKQHTRGGFKTKRAAQGHLNEVLGKIQAGTWTPDRKMSVSELLTEWQAAKKSEGLRPATLEHYRNVADKWIAPRVGAVKLSTLAPTVAQQMVEELRTSGSRKAGPLSDRSVQSSVVVLKAATAWAFETGLISRDPLAGFRRPRAQAKTSAGEAWMADEARAFLDGVVDDRLIAAWTLLLTRGLRRGELAGLRWDVVDLDARVIRVVRTRVLVDGRAMESEPKTDAGRRTIPLDVALVSTLRSHWARQAEERLTAGEAWRDEDYVFTNELGAPLYPDYFSSRFEALVNEIGLRCARSLKLAFCNH